MPEQRSPSGGAYDVRRGERAESVRRAFAEFVTLPLILIGVILVLGGAGTYALDKLQPASLRGLHDFLERHYWPSADTTGQILQTISQTVITVTSITFSLLLVTVQQTSTSLSSQVFDQFLRRRSNQVCFGFFVGLGVLSLWTAASVNPRFNPVFGATLILVCGMAAVGLLLFLLYTTINQMRPTVVLEAIHDHVVETRVRLLRDVVQRTRREVGCHDLPAHAVHSEQTGFVHGIDLGRVASALREAGGGEVVLEAEIGSFVAYGDRLALLHLTQAESAPALAQAVRRAVRLERQRTIGDHDAVFGVQQIATIGWTSISSANQNPASGALAIVNLRDILARVSVEPERPADEAPLPIVYPDTFPEALVAAFESFAVAAGEAHQHQTMAEILDAMTASLERLPDTWKVRCVEVLVRTLPIATSMTPTGELQRALERVSDALDRAGEEDAAEAVRRAHAESVGRIPGPEGARAVGARGDGASAVPH